jgi:hypothetical protein
VSANLPRNNEPGDEDNLLVEAVSLLVQRQRETEKWVAEQVAQAEERTAATERRYAELEARLAALEEQLSRVAREVEPTRADAAPDERLARLRAQLEALKSGGNGVPAALPPQPPRSASDAPKTTPAPARGPDVARASAAEARSAAPQERATSAAAPEYQPLIPIPSEPRSRYTSPATRAPLRGRAGTPSPPQGVTFLNLLGSSPEDRYALVFIGVGGVAVLYAALSLLRGG